MSLKTLLLRTLSQRNRFINFAPIAIWGENYKKYEDGEVKRRKYGKLVAAALFSSVLVGNVSDKIEKHKVKGDSHQPANTKSFEAGLKRPDLPTFTAEEVSKHDSKGDFWVTYKHGVYDVTKFLPSHPGGEQILNAGGLSIEPFWNVYGMHKTPEVYTLLESYRIGNLHDDDVVDHTDEDMWAKEPYRDKRLIVKTPKPFNAEIPPKYQIQHFDTPNELFYVRQHMPVPDISPAEHRLRVSIHGAETSWSLEELRQFPPAEVRAALMCAGNRRSEMNEVKPVKGISWAQGAISNAVWSGVYLRDVLLQCGVDCTDTEGLHVILEGADVDATGVNFSTSIPLRQALDPGSRVVLATRMNGRALPPDHGRPLRAVVPGAPAVRSVKWLKSITVSKEESGSHWHQKDYRAFNPSTTWETAHFPSAPPLYSLPVTSAICEPLEGDTITPVDGCVEIKGYAYSGGGAKIVRVDVSTDGGARWTEAELRCDSAPPRLHYSWTLWTATVPVEDALTEVPPRLVFEFPIFQQCYNCHDHGMTEELQVEVWVKATDSNFNTQPEKFDDIWNIRGLLSNAYHKIKVNVKH